MSKRVIFILFVLLLATGLAFAEMPTYVFASKMTEADTNYQNTISSGGTIMGAVKKDGTLWVWGEGRFGDLGTGSYNAGNRIAYFDGGIISAAYQDVPVRLMNDVRSVCMSSGGASFAIKTDNSLWAWGTSNNDIGPETPHKIAEDVIAVTRNYKTTAIIKSDHSLWMKGGNPDGRFGVITPFEEYEDFIKCMDDVAVFSFDNTMAVSAGFYQEAIVKTDGSLWVWGVDVPKSIRQLPEGYTLEEAVKPTKVMDGVSSVACGSFSLFILKTDGSLWSAGDSNGSGQLGIGSKDVPSAPVKILDNVKQIRADQNTVAAVKKDGSLWLWGQVPEIVLGNGTRTETNCLKPTKVMENVDSVTVTSATVYALKTDGTLWGWGSNYFGQLGIGGYSVLDMNADTKNVPDSEIYTYLLKTKYPDPVLIMKDVSLSKTSSSPVIVMDPNPSAWAKDIVERAIEQGLVPEKLQGNYTKPITRAEFCALAATLYESRNGEITERSTFTDTKDVNVEKLASLGVVAGVGDGKFAPDRQITREQAATMLAALAGVLGKPIEESEPTFADSGDISSWAIPYVGKMQTSGIMNGTGNDRFSPQGSYTREQSIATMLSVLAYIDE